MSGLSGGCLLKGRIVVDLAITCGEICLKVEVARSKCTVVVNEMMFACNVRGM